MWVSIEEPNFGVTDKLKDTTDHLPSQEEFRLFYDIYTRYYFRKIHNSVNSILVADDFTSSTTVSWIKN